MKPDENQSEIWRARKTLAEWAAAVERIRELNRESERYAETSRECYDTLSRAPPDGTSHADGKARDMEETLERAERTARECAQAIKRNSREIERLFLLKAEMDRAVWALPPSQERAVTLRYKRHQKWETIARQLNASERTVRRWDHAALKKLSRNEKLTAFVRKSVV
ncbi:MAG: hypothetical protein LBS11_11155 [Oscillospiraceae bacterium]|jgi:DNA-directed RNA polymerase specialized sigma24 family protein|nr:hypothetical protein [Oscillospiraceae bacterium]